MAEIFVSYRRADSQDVTARLVDQLVTYLGDEAIFRDIYDIDPGRDFTEVLRDSLAECRIFIPVIGPRWLHELQRRREHHQQGQIDWVYEEVTSALQANKLIVPLCIHGATMPAADDLPEALRPLAAVPPLPLREALFAEDIKALLRHLLADEVGEPVLRRMLEEAFDFETGDLDENRDGKMSRRQRAVHVLNTTDTEAINTSLGLVAFVMIVLIAVTVGIGLLLVEIGAATALIAAVGLCFMLPLLILALVLIAMVRAPVKIAEGVVTLDPEAKSLKVGDTDLELMPGQEPALVLELLASSPMRIYYRKVSWIEQVVLSVEILREVSHAPAVDAGLSQTGT